MLTFQIIESTLRGETGALGRGVDHRLIIQRESNSPTLSSPSRRRLRLPRCKLSGGQRVTLFLLLPSSSSIFALCSLARLDEFGVEYIELTSPAASPESRAHCEAICKLGLKRTKILTHIRCHMDDARLAVETGVDGVDVVIGTSSFLREHSHGKDMTWITKT